MNKKSFLKKGLLCAGLAIAAVFGANEVSAQAGGKDKEIATKKGVSESLGNKEFDQEKLPGTLEIGLALGSIVAMIAAIKWL